MKSILYLGVFLGAVVAASCQCDAGAKLKDLYSMLKHRFTEHYGEDIDKMIEDFDKAMKVDEWVDVLISFSTKILPVWLDNARAWEKAVTAENPAIDADGSIKDLQDRLNMQIGFYTGLLEGMLGPDFSSFAEQLAGEVVSFATNFLPAMSSKFLEMALAFETNALAASAVGVPGSTNSVQEFQKVITSLTGC